MAGVSQTRWCWQLCSHVACHDPKNNTVGRRILLPMLCPQALLLHCIQVCCTLRSGAFYFDWVDSLVLTLSTVSQVWTWISVSWMNMWSSSRRHTMQRSQPSWRPVHSPCGASWRTAKSKWVPCICSLSLSLSCCSWMIYGTCISSVGRCRHLLYNLASIFYDTVNRLLTGNARIH